MKTMNPFMQSFDNLPRTLPIFPLKNAVVMPGGQLPLNIFEPRYLNMLKDSMESHRLIGMIQPRDDSHNPALFDIGCAARVTRYEETTDGRLEIALTGLCRFKIKEELNSTRGYRLIMPEWDDFKNDYEEEQSSDEHHESFINALQHYFDATKFNIDWEQMKNLSTADLFNTLYYFIELTPADKQMLLEIDTTEQRIKALMALLASPCNDSMISH